MSKNEIRNSLLEKLIPKGTRNTLFGTKTPVSPVASVVRHGESTSITAGETPASPVAI